eukprot:gene11192-biopygen8723
MLRGYSNVPVTLRIVPRSCPGDIPGRPPWSGATSLGAQAKPATRPRHARDTPDAQPR